METLLLSVVEIRILKKSKHHLEKLHNIEIRMPEIGTEFCSKDLHLVSIVGGDSSNVLAYVKREKETYVQKEAQRCTVTNNITTVTLSDSDSDDDPKTSVESDIHCSGRKQICKTLAPDPSPIKTSKCDITIDLEEELESCTKNHTVPAPEFISLIPETKAVSGNDSVIILDSPQPTTSVQEHRRANKKKKRKRPCSEPVGDDSVIVLDPEPAKPIPKVRDPRFLRPIIIDGSNVARAHGMRGKTFSVEGIKISIDYFLNRGHTQVTAFVPNYRRHYKLGPHPTTSQNILEELHEKQLVVFTPSRKVNGKTYTCYDDRFIVDLASRTGGVILSNDNYRDLIDESQEFKTTIEERLLMFCFVGDNFMVPNDPLGRNGPKLDDFLSFPEPH